MGPAWEEAGPFSAVGLQHVMHALRVCPRGDMKLAGALRHAMAFALGGMHSLP